MKEILKTTLTDNVQGTYAKYGGIFMTEKGGPDNMSFDNQQSTPEGLGDKPQAPKLDVGKPVPPERQSEARQNWEEVNKGKVIPIEERRTIGELVKRGVSPVAGGADRLNLTDYADGKLQDIVREINAEVSRAGAGDSPGPRFIREKLVKVRHLMDTQQINQEEGLGLSAELEGWIDEIQQTVGATMEDWKEQEIEEAHKLRETEIRKQIATLRTGITDPGLLAEITRLESFLDSGKPQEDALLEAVGNVSVFITKNKADKEQQKEKLRKELVVLSKRVIGENTRYRTDMYRIKRGEGFYGEKKLTPEEKNRIWKAKKPEDIEDIFNDMFKTVDARPTVDFDTGFGTKGTMEEMEFLTVLGNAIAKNEEQHNLVRAKQLEDIRNKFTNEKMSKSLMHNAYYAAVSGQDTKAMKQYIESFQSGYLDIAFGKAGVVQAAHCYEQALKLVMAQHGGYLPAKAVVGELKNNEDGEVNELTAALLRQENESGLLAVDEKGQPKQLEEWELKRALSFARGLGIVTGSTIEIAAKSILPGVESEAGTYIDVFGYKIVGQIYPRFGGLRFKLDNDSPGTRIMTFLMDSKRIPWTPKEQQAFDALGWSGKLKVFNDLVPEDQELFISILNPFGIGGMFSISGWRAGGDAKWAGESAINKMLLNGDEEWIGTGITIEKHKGKLNSKDKREAKIAKAMVWEALEKTAEMTPLRFFLEMREFKEKVLTDLLKDQSYFEKDELKRIKDEIERRITETEEKGEKKEEKYKKLLGKEYKEKSEEGEKEEQEKMKFHRMRITAEVVMNSDTFKDDVRKLVVLQEKALLQKDTEMVMRESALGKILHGKLSDTALDADGKPLNANGKKETFMEAIIRRMKDRPWKTPFVMGTEDIPFNKYVFEQTGPKTAARRWGDMENAAQAGELFHNLMLNMGSFKDQGTIVEKMKEIFFQIEPYSTAKAMEFMGHLTEGIMKFYQKSWINRLPAGIGSAVSIFGNSSYAQIAFGRGAMAWDEANLNEFTRLVRDANLIKGEEQQHEIQKRAGGTKAAVAWGYARTVLPLILMAMSMYVAATVYKEEND